MQFRICNYDEPHANPLKQRRGKSFIEEKGKLGGAVVNKSHWRKLGVRSIV